MMEFPVVHAGCEVGRCVLTEQGLYWQLECICSVLSDRVERLYIGEKRLGVLEKEGDRLVCRRRLSKSSTPDLPPQNGLFTLEPIKAYESWSGSILGKPMTGFQDGDWLLFPYETDKPCPCEPLICFFEVRNGYWCLPMKEEWLKNPDEA